MPDIIFKDVSADFQAGAGALYLCTSGEDGITATLPPIWVLPPLATQADAPAAGTNGRPVLPFAVPIDHLRVAFRKVDEVQGGSGVLVVVSPFDPETVTLDGHSSASIGFQGQGFVVESLNGQWHVVDGAPSLYP